MSRFPFMRGRWKWLTVATVVLLLPLVALFVLNEHRRALIEEASDASGSVLLSPRAPDAMFILFYQLGIDPSPNLLYDVEWYVFNPGSATAAGVRSKADAVNRLENVSTVDFSGSPSVDPEVFTALREWKNIERMRLSDAGIDDDDLAAVARLSNLRQLDLDGNGKLTVDGLRHLSAMPGLERLSLVLTNVRGGEVIQVLQSMPALKEVRLGGTTL
ncbi:MAG: hypothetical protein WBC44_18420, partial [Planctomycetaceae bacterium]